MAQRAQVPKFGNWDSEEVPYTTYFDNARMNKKHQNDPLENSGAESKVEKVSEAKLPKQEALSSQEEVKLRVSTGSPLHTNATGDKPQKAREMNRPMHERRMSREEVDMRKLTDSPFRHEAAGLRNGLDSPRHNLGALSGGSTPRRASRQSVGSDRSVDQSPLHPHSQAKVGGKNSGFSSPSWERKSTAEGSHGLAPSTPGRSRLRSVTRGDATPDHSPIVPKFGEWDETDPATAEGYSHIFSRVREEKHNETGKVPIMPTDASYANGQKQIESDSIKGCGCFSWGRR